MLRVAYRMLLLSELKQLLACDVGSRARKPTNPAVADVFVYSRSIPVMVNPLHAVYFICSCLFKPAVERADLIAPMHG